jgi:hypothetical protein
VGTQWDPMVFDNNCYNYCPTQWDPIDKNNSIRKQKFVNLQAMKPIIHKEGEFVEKVFPHPSRFTVGKWNLQLHESAKAYSN